MAKSIIILLSGLILLVACGKEPEPRSVDEFIDNPILLEAAVVRCSQNRSQTRYDAECINARAAVDRVEARQEAERRKLLEAESERKRRALRRTQQAAAEARRRSVERERLRKEAEYLAQFGELPPSGEPMDQQSMDQVAGGGNAPGMVISEPDAIPESEPEAVPGPAPAQQQTPSASGVTPEPAPDAQSEPPADLGDIRDELKRRAEENPE